MDTDKHRDQNTNECVNQYQWDHTKRILIQLTSLVLFVNIIFFTPPVQAQPFYATPNTVDFEDFIAFVESFGKKKGDQKYYPIMDLNDDGEINFPDFISFAQSFGGNFSEPKIPVTITSNTSYQLSDNTSQITLSFSHPVRITNENGISLLNTHINLETSHTDTTEIKPQNIHLDANRTTLTITIPNIISNNTYLLLTPPKIKTTLSDSFYLIPVPSFQYTNSLWVYHAYQPILNAIQLSTPFTPAQATLSLRPFAPTNTNYFTPGVYTEATPMTPATSDTLTETTARTALETFLAKRITNPDTLQQALAKYDDATLIAKMPNPTLRAGLISLTGTLAQNAIDAITRGPFGPLTFGTVTTGDYAQINSDRSVTVDQRYTSEAFPLFGPIFTRMALQLDLQTGRNEEITTSAFLAIVAMQQTLTDSTVAQSTTELSRRLNTQMLARLNSGQANFPNIGIHQTPNGQAFPNGASFPSYAAVFAPLTDTTTPAGNLLTTYLTNLSPQNTQLPNATTFNTDVLTFIDQHQNILSPEDLIRIAHTLKLTTP